MYRKNTINKSNLSKNLIKQLEEDDDNDEGDGGQDEFYLPPNNVKLNDSYKSLTQLKFDDSSHLYIDYYTCQEYNKKLLKKLNNLSRNNELLNHKIKEIKVKDSIDQETDKISTVENKSVSSKAQKNDDKNFYEYILPKSNKAKTKSGDDRREILEQLFEADTVESIREVGDKLTANIDQIIADLDIDDSPIKVENQHLFKRLDQLQRENDRYRYLFEILETELN